MSRKISEATKVSPKLDAVIPVAQDGTSGKVELGDIKGLSMRKLESSVFTTSGSNMTWKWDKSYGSCLVDITDNGNYGTINVSIEIDDVMRAITTEELVVIFNLNTVPAVSAEHADLKLIGEVPDFEEGKTYILSIQNYTLVFGEISDYIN